LSHQTRHRVGHVFATQGLIHHDIQAFVGEVIDYVSDAPPILSST